MIAAGLSVARPWRLIDFSHGVFAGRARRCRTAPRPTHGAYTELLQQIRSAYIYPPPVAFIVVPFTALPDPVAAAAFNRAGDPCSARIAVAAGRARSRCFAVAAAGPPDAHGRGRRCHQRVCPAAVAVAWRWRDSLASHRVGGGGSRLRPRSSAGRWLVWLVITRRLVAGRGVGRSPVWRCSDAGRDRIRGIDGYLHLLRWVDGERGGGPLLGRRLLHAGRAAGGGAGAQRVLAGSGAEATVHRRRRGAGFGGRGGGDAARLAGGLGSLLRAAGGPVCARLAAALTAWLVRCAHGCSSRPRPRQARSPTLCPVLAVSTCCELAATPRLHPRLHKRCQAPFMHGHSGAGSVTGR